MKKLISLFLLCTVICTAAFFCVIYAGAEPLDTSHPCSLTLCYTHNSQVYRGLRIQTYKIAQLRSDGEFELCTEFQKYPVRIHDVRSQAEWKKITATLSSYITADSIVPHYTKVTDSEGKVSYENITTGLYLTLAVRHETDERVTVFEDFITAVPSVDGNGEYIYDVTAIPKQRSYTPTPSETVYKVVKQWKDSSDSAGRPDGVDVDIFRDGVLVESVRLSAENDWCYSWTASDDKSIWSAVERNVPDGYKVTVDSDGKTIVITNIRDIAEQPPFTGDTEPLWHYVLVLCVSGVALIAVAVLRQRRER